MKINKNYIIKKITIEYALEITNWQYEGIYSIYNLTNNNETIAELLNNNYYVLVDNNNFILGFYCCGYAATIPYAHSLQVYDDINYLDIGLSMNPILTGKGFGYDFVKIGIDYFSQMYNTNKFRLSVYDFNTRAIKTYEKIGFTIKTFFKANLHNHYFLVMVYN